MSGARAVWLGKNHDGKLYGKVQLVPCEPADKDRIAAGKQWLDAEETKFLIETKGRVHTVHFAGRERPWRAEFLPRRLQFAKGRKLYDYVHSYPGGNNAYAHSCLVSPPLKELMEAHRNADDGWQFFPVEIMHKDGTPYDTYFAWCVHRTVDGVDPACEGVTSVSGPVDGDHHWTWNGKRCPERQRVLASETGRLTAWSDYRFYPFVSIFVSETLFRAMSDAGMTGFSADSVWNVV